MPKVGMRSVRRNALVNAAIDEIGKVGSLEVTVAQIAERAGVSSALAHHYFGSKEQILLAAMRHILIVFGDEVRLGLKAARTPEDRLKAIIEACFSPANFHKHVIAAWLNFYVLALRSKEAQRLLSIYHRRLRSGLIYELRALDIEYPEDTAERIGGLIDGLYLRCAIGNDSPSGPQATDHLLEALEQELKK